MVRRSNRVVVVGAYGGGDDDDDAVSSSSSEGEDEDEQEQQEDEEEEATPPGDADAGADAGKAAPRRVTPAVAAAGQDDGAPPAPRRRLKIALGQKGAAAGSADLTCKVGRGTGEVHAVYLGRGGQSCHGQGREAQGFLCRGVRMSLGCASCSRGGRAVHTRACARPSPQLLVLWCAAEPLTRADPPESQPESWYMP